MRPEEKIASLWIRKLGLVHPVVIEDVLREFADVYDDTFPIDAEAILIHQRQGGASRPKVIVARGMSRSRRTFTLAHELGHLLIPWHCGDFVCKPSAVNAGSIDELIDEMNYQEIEREANRFAAQFLMPGEILCRLMVEGGVDLVVKYVERGDISIQAAFIKLIGSLPSGYILVVSDGIYVKSSQRSKGTFMEVLDVQTPLDFSQYEAVGGVVSLFESRGATYHWIDLTRAKVSKVLCEKYFATWGDALSEILRDLGFGGQKLVKITQRINGIVGAAISKAKHMPNADYFTIVKVCLQKHHDLASLTNHEYFDEFLDLRCDSIEQRHRAGKK